MWPFLAGVSIISAFFLSPLEWSFVAAVCFGIPEIIAISKHHDRYPPLTYVTAYYLPRWFTMTTIGFLVGAIGGIWFGFSRPYSLGALLGLLTWSISHFDVTYSEKR